MVGTSAQQRILASFGGIKHAFGMLGMLRFALPFCEMFLGLADVRNGHLFLCFYANIVLIEYGQCMPYVSLFFLILLFQKEKKTINLRYRSRSAQSFHSEFFS